MGCTRIALKGENTLPLTELAAVHEKWPPEYEGRGLGGGRERPLLTRSGHLAVHPPVMLA